MGVEVGQQSEEVWTAESDAFEHRGLTATAQDDVVAAARAWHRLRPVNILALQRFAGNRAVARLVLARAASTSESGQAQPQPPKTYQLSERDLPRVASDPELVERARQFRLKNGMLSDAAFRQNVCVIKYERDGKVDYLVRANDPARLHSEHEAIKELEKADPQWQRTEILEVYTERHPCAGCEPNLQFTRMRIKQLRAARGQKITDFRVYYSISKWEPRNSRAKELRRQYFPTGEKGLGTPLGSAARGAPPTSFKGTAKQAGKAVATTAGLIALDWIIQKGIDRLDRESDERYNNKEYHRLYEAKIQPEIERRLEAQQGEIARLADDDPFAPIYVRIAENEFIDVEDSSDKIPTEGGDFYSDVHHHERLKDLSLDAVEVSHTPTPPSYSDAISGTEHYHVLMFDVTTVHVIRHRESSSQLDPSTTLEERMLRSIQTAVDGRVPLQQVIEAHPNWTPQQQGAYGRAYVEVTAEDDDVVDLHEDAAAYREEVARERRLEGFYGKPTVQSARAALYSGKSVRELGKAPGWASEAQRDRFVRAYVEVAYEEAGADSPQYKEALKYLREIERAEAERERRAKRTRQRPHEDSHARKRKRGEPVEPDFDEEELKRRAREMYSRDVEEERDRHEYELDREREEARTRQREEDERAGRLIE